MIRQGHRALVFAYHSVGVRCIKTLLARSVDIPLVVTHHDQPGETLWFDSVAGLCDDYGIRWIAPEKPDGLAILAELGGERPDLLFSFYYRHMLDQPILDLPIQGAYNLHGSLLPKYRGRVPVNWAIIHGETETGATLHVMNIKPDNGPIIDQQSVPILPDDTALDVFRKVTCAAECVLYRALPALLDGSARPTPQDLSQGAYFGGRKPGDGRIDWPMSARSIHNLIRAVAPPFPGAFTTIAGQPVRILRSRVEPNPPQHFIMPVFYAEAGHAYAQCGEGTLRILQGEIAGHTMTGAELANHLGPGPHPLIGTAAT